MWEEGKTETAEIKDDSWKELSSFVHKCHQLPEEPSLKWTLTVTNLGAEFWF
jgi:hypothetical protein